ncbi:MAG: GNAT family N-acetyltransferase [Prevotellaceae bacterium]|jgi:ribosomal protein S18 acetylase RimI-like enzyme|nr:GNAT family N-acetyltransferase [Prevotellaceae bacterium]
MIFQRITSPGDNLFPEMLKLYKSAFPPEERRSGGDLQQEIVKSERFYANAVMENGVMLGIFNYWNFGTFFYLEHFAVNPGLRGKNLGSKSLQLFHDTASGLPIVLEVEMPNTTEATRRIEFYKRAGFQVVPKDYAQPPYRPGGFMLPMLLMTNKIHAVKTHFEKIKNTIYREVYHFKP